MVYTFSNLSPADFEDLVRDLIGRELGVRFEAFSAGPDGGVDGRHSVATKSIVLQAKRYLTSRFGILQAAIRRERASIDRLKPVPKRYILATSHGLTRKNKATLAALIGPVLKNQQDIFGAEDLNGLLRKFPDIEKANIKLWLSGAAVLERVLRSAIYTYTAISRAEIESKVRVYAQNPSFREARDKLEANHVLIISGPPGVGKTTLAEMLSYAYIGEEWDFVAIRRLEDGFAAIVDSKKQIFFFDDFLGKIALDTRALAAKDSDLTRFIKRIRTSANARFILTTRSPIFEEARRVSEHLADERLDILRYILDVGIYTRRIRARILYNHLFVSGVSMAHIKALWDTEAIAKIVDHNNYNPRIIEAMTDGLHTRVVDSEAYPTAFLNALNNPHQLWDTAFRTHIPTKCRHLLFALFFCSQYGVGIDELKAAFDALHPLMCKQYNVAQDVKDFEESLKILEGGFVSINGGRVSFINPSVRDYLADYLNDTLLFSTFAKAARKADWAESVWRHATKVAAKTSEERSKVASAFKGVAPTFLQLPVMKRDPVDPRRYHFCDSSLSNRLSLLLEWHAATQDSVFSDSALLLSEQRSHAFSSWSDGQNLVRLVGQLRVGSYKDLPFAGALADELERGIINIFEGAWADDLGTMWDAIEDARDVLGRDVFDAARGAVVREIEEAGSTADGTDSESTLSDHIKMLERLAPQAGVPAAKLAYALSVIQNRIVELNEQTEEAPSPSFSGRQPREVDRFDDEALRNLFAPLVEAR